MCFSAEASFFAGAVLVPCGIAALRRAWQVDKRYLGFAAFPLLFGLQQVTEGGVWLSLVHGQASGSIPLALGFLFFAYWLWPVLVPLSSFLVEENRLRRQIFGALTLIGFLLGTALFLPVFLDAASLKILVVRNSILYDGRLIISGDLAKPVLRAIYSVIICFPLIASTHPRVRVFGYLIATSVLIGFAFASYAFTSIWCFLAALLSAYILAVVHGLEKAADADSPAPWA